ncbi:MAG TPA: 5'-methylthioadenosine/adenosylhomocysteine nucleosidase [Bacteroidales bacterium]|nr:5'-methylthioadenosine/adenosylhomocysteine nucleosidase [Bacteroidales bacterium]
MKNKTVGIIGAMPEEVMGIVELLSDRQEKKIGERIYYYGHINNISTVVVISGWGKVSAAMTISTLIHHFNISEVIFTGVAGAIQPQLNIGDIVIGKRLVYHDMDARPLIPQFQIPSLGKIFIETQTYQLQLAKKAIEVLLNNLIEYNLKKHGITQPVLHIGDIASGDQFFSSNQQKTNLLKNLPTVLCVEMEGAAVAHVCEEHNIPFTVIRTISDKADETSNIDFLSFIKQIASRYSVDIIKNIYSLY